MKSLFSLLFVVIALWCVVPPSLLAQVRVRGVMGSSNGKTRDGSFGIRGTASQTAIGIVQRSGGEHRVGFWYTACLAMNRNNTSCLVVLPTQEVFIGTRVFIPLLLQESRNINAAKIPPRRFEARIRCNATLLEPLNARSIQRINDEYIFTVQGERAGKDSVGVLAQIEFLVKAGNAESTPLIIEDFRWLDNANILTLKKDGEAIIGGICREGDTLRLLHRTKKAMIVSVFPQPAANEITIDMSFNEKGATMLYLSDMKGATVATLLDEVISVSVRSIKANLSDIPSGSYFLMMRTPNELISRKVIVLK